MIYLTNGNMPLNAAYADEIVQEDNSTYQLSFRFPTSDSLWEKLKEETFLAADDLHGEQDFVIFEVEKKHGYIQVYANQVFTLLNNYVVNPISLDRQTGSTALSRFAGAITRNNPFSFFSDIEDRHTFNIGSKNAMEAFAKDKHSILGQWGGDLVRHSYQVRLLKNGGSENESLFMYKKNLSSYQHKTSTKSLKTRITFIATVKGEKAPDRTFTVTIDSPLINKYSQIYEDVIEVNDQDVKDEASLRRYGEQYFKISLCDMMEDSLEIEVVGQSDVPVQMFDVVSIFHERYNLDVRKKITKYTYSPMAKKLKSIGFGQFQSGLANAIGNAVSDAVKGEAQQLQDDFERQLARELKNADLAFDRQKEDLVNQFQDGMNAAYAKAEEVRMELSDTIDQRLQEFDDGPINQIRLRADEILRQAGASSLLAQEAKRIGLDSITKLEEFKRQATSAQTALLSDLDALKRTVTNDIRPKQAQAEAEIAKQIEALNRTKNELVSVKSAQTTYEETTTRRLAELTNLANGKASKSELVQTAEELKSKIASMQVGGRNYIRGTRRMALASGLWTSGTFRQSGVGTAKTIDVSNSPATGFDKAIRLTSNNARDQIGIAQDGFEIMSGTYTMSVWVKGSAGQRVRIQTYWTPDDSTGISPEFILKDDKWTYLTFSSERKKAGKLSIGYVYLVNADAGEYLDVLAPQLENGSLATSPKEAPEDTDGQISAVESTFKQRADSLEAGVNRLTEGFRTKADISSLNVTAENIRQSVKSLETSTQNKLDQKLSMAEFEVRASGIRQEIVNATKDKADKTLVTAEAGKIREEFSKMKVGSRNYAEDYDFSRGLWIYSQGDSSPVDWKIINGEYNVKGTTSTWKQMQIHSKEGSRTSGKNSTALLELEIGETYTLSFQGICYSGSSNVWVSLRANRTVAENPEIMYGNFNLTSSWQTYQVTIPDLTKPDNFDFWRIILGYSGIGHVAFRKVELTRSSTRIDAGPAPEDGKTDLVVAKSEFQKTADGLSAKLATVETYVSQDDQRQEALRKYSRDESAKQVTAVRELVTRDYVGKATYQEDVRGINQRIEETKKNARNELTTQLANYRQTVDGKFTDISSQVTTYKQVADGQISNLSNRLTTEKQGTDSKIANLTNQVTNNKASSDNQIANLSNQLAKKVEITDFQRVRETSQFYERILGTTEQGLPDKVSRLVMSSSIFQTEVGNFFVSDNNLIVNSETLDKYTLVGQRSGVSLGPQNGMFAINAAALPSFNWSGFTLPIYIPKILKGEVYTLSFKYKIKRKLDHEFRVVIKNHSKNKGVFQKVVANPSDQISSDWIEFQATSTMSEDFDFGTGNDYPLYFYLVKNGYVEIKEPILVRGSRSSSYKPSQFDDAYKATENAKQLAENAQAKAVQVAEQVNQTQQIAEATRTQVNQLAGSWAVQNLTSAGSIVSQINATNNQILIEAEKIRLKGKTLLDELTAIQGYFKRLFVGEGAFAKLNAEIIASKTITADKLVMDMAMARMFVSSDIFTDTLAAKEAFINKLRSVVVTATLLEGYKGRIGGFQIGTHEKDPSTYWITGQNHFSVGMSNGSGPWHQTALWVNWGNDWNSPSDTAWFVKNTGQMFCYNRAEFWNTPTIHGDLRVTGEIYYNNNASGGGSGYWISSPKYSKIEPSGGHLYLYYSGGGYDWIPMNKDVSDRRYKSKIQYSTVSGLDVVENLKTYNYRKEYDGKIQDVACGIMAQDVQKYAPEAFFENPDGAYSYNTFALVPYLIKAIQELNQKIEKLEKTA